MLLADSEVRDSCRQQHWSKLAAISSGSHVVLCTIWYLMLMAWTRYGKMAFLPIGKLECDESWGEDIPFADWRLLVNLTTAHRSCFRLCTHGALQWGYQHPPIVGSDNPRFCHCPFHCVVDHLGVIVAKEGQQCGHQSLGHLLQFQSSNPYLVGQ